MSKKHAEEVVDFVFDTIADTMKRGDEVSIAGFGTFVAKQRKARQARNPKTGATVNVPAMKVPKFKAGKGLKDAVR
ncbi:MAG: Histone family protein DNA-binding protein [Parcubacteria group bacterium GW2011_GWB1_44_7]|nr:MAG: Histone family protein DNA-binding protein [Parcubacteria group bacterium GW2011_GWB1_44_7]